MPTPKTVREHLEDGTLGPLRTRAEIEREEKLIARIEELDDFRVRVAKALGVPAEASDDQLIHAINSL